jgi:MerR family transcriptional regulator, repressor of the yfmOP operon
MTSPVADPAQSTLLGIGEAAARLGTSERALRYYQQLGLITPSGRTPGGIRRYSEGDLERVSRIRELQELLGFNLEEIRSILDNEDRLQAVRAEYRSETTDANRRRELVQESLALQIDLKDKVETKLDRLQRFRDDLETRAERMRQVLADAE